MQWQWMYPRARAGLCIMHAPCIVSIRKCQFFAENALHCVKRSHFSLYQKGSVTSEYAKMRLWPRLCPRLRWAARDAPPRLPNRLGRGTPPYSRLGRERCLATPHPTRRLRHIGLPIMQPKKVLNYAMNTIEIICKILHFT